MKIYALEICACVALVICLLFSSAAEFESECDGIRTDVLRFHVLANSDTDEDQELKLKVRDEVLEKGKEIFSGSSSKDEAIEKISNNIEVLTETARDVVLRNGYDYDVQVKIENCFFPTRTYDTVTLPAGTYQAVRVLIGKAQGHNWWCVMFPAMCISAAQGESELGDVLDEEEFELVKSSPKYELRFWFVEKYEEFMLWLENRE